MIIVSGRHLGQVPGREQLTCYFCKYDSNTFYCNYYYYSYCSYYNYDCYIIHGYNRPAPWSGPWPGAGASPCRAPPPPRPSE